MSTKRERKLHTKGEPISLCRFIPGGDYHLVDGVYLGITGKHWRVRVDGTEVRFARADWVEVIA